jgi:hypothetical protein
MSFAPWAIGIPAAYVDQGMFGHRAFDLALFGAA